MNDQEQTSGAEGLSTDDLWKRTTFTIIGALVLGMFQGIIFGIGRLAHNIIEGVIGSLLQGVALTAVLSIVVIPVAIGVLALVRRVVRVPPPERLPFVWFACVDLVAFAGAFLLTLAGFRLPVI